MNLKYYSVLGVATLAIATLLPNTAQANRVTVITHGFGANVDEWIVPMANRMANYTAFWGTASSCYEINVSSNGGAFVVTSEFLDGVAANSSDSGNIFIKLDWSDVAGYFNSIVDYDPAQFDVSQIASIVVPALLDSTLIPDLGGHALADFPLHLVGHSRGGSLVTEIARELGESGIWIDHITTLDPHPCDPASGFIEAFGCPVNDAAPILYENVFFADNYWQDDAYPTGQNVEGAYNRFLSSLLFGYGSPHSNTHLWYHGTIDFTSPVTTDTGADLTDTDRLTWFTVGETNGTWTGFLNSNVGGGDRFSTNQPAGPGTPAIVDGVIGSRLPLPANDGTWPNIITLNAVNDGWFNFTTEPGLAVREENVVLSNGTLAISADYQNGEDSTVSYFLDPDANALNGNEIPLASESLTATGISSISNVVRVLTIDSQTVENGLYFLASEITANTSGASRILYAPQKIAVLEPLQLTIESTSPNESQLTVTGSAGYNAVIEMSSSFSGWDSVVTNSFTGDAIGDPDSVPNQISTSTANEFFRASYRRP